MEILVIAVVLLVWWVLIVKLDILLALRSVLHPFVIALITFGLNAFAAISICLGIGWLMRLIFGATA